MAYVITDTCTKDLLYADVCPTDCIHPKKDETGFEEAKQLFVDPVGLIVGLVCRCANPTQFTRWMIWGRVSSSLST
jgi:hypothetical protein